MAHSIKNTVIATIPIGYADGISRTAMAGQGARAQC
jgi:alanine racemase